MPTRRAGVGLLLGLALIAGVGVPPSALRAQDTTDRKVTLNLRDTPLRDSISLLFAGSGLQYSVDPNVPNIPLNLNIKDISLQAALRMLIRQAAVASPGLTFSRDGDVFVVKIRSEAPRAATAEDSPPERTANEASELVWEKIPIQFNDVMVFTLAFGGTMLPTEADLKMNSSSGGMGGMSGGMSGSGSNSGTNFGGGIGNGQGSSLGSSFGSSLGGNSNSTGIGNSTGNRRF